jgi:hypothetical protein
MLVLLLVLNRKEESPDFQSAGEAAVKTDSGTPCVTFYMTPDFTLLRLPENVEDRLYHILVAHPLCHFP